MYLESCSVSQSTIFWGGLAPYGFISQTTVLSWRWVKVREMWEKEERAWAGSGPVLKPKLSTEVTTNLRRVAGLKWHSTLAGISRRLSKREKVQSHLESPSKKVKYLNTSLKILHNVRQKSSNAFKNITHFCNTFWNMESKL